MAAHASGKSGRLVFALDATMSRQPTWDMACQLQADMFREAGSIGGYSRTPQGKVIAAAFMDSYNQLVVSLRNYKAQTVRGQGLGGGGRLGVDGGAAPSQTYVPSEQPTRRRR